MKALFRTFCSLVAMVTLLALMPIVSSSPVGAGTKAPANADPKAQDDDADRALDQRDEAVLQLVGDAEEQVPLELKKHDLALARVLVHDRPLQEHAPGTVDHFADVQPARRAKVEGEVQAEVSIDKNGRVSDVQIVKSPMPSMAEATVTALKASSFRPGMKDGTPVPVQVTMTVRFKLQ